MRILTLTLTESNSNSISLSLSLFLCVSPYLFVSLSLSLSLCLSLSLSVSFSFSFSLSLYMRTLTTLLGKTHRESIRISTNGRNTRIMMDFCGFFQGESSEFARLPEIPYTMHPLKKPPILWAWVFFFPKKKSAARQVLPLNCPLVEGFILRKELKPSFKGEREVKRHPKNLSRLLDASFLLTVEVFLLTVRLFYLRWGNRK